jgi:hypothetical protein
MRFFSSWWERLPTRHIAPLLITSLVLGFGWGSAFEVLKVILKPVGAYWD